jgi:hypothetical protein
MVVDFDSYLPLDPCGKSGRSSKRLTVSRRSFTSRPIGFRTETDTDDERKVRVRSSRVEREADERVDGNRLEAADAQELPSLSGGRGYRISLSFGKRLRFEGIVPVHS